MQTNQQLHSPATRTFVAKDLMFSTNHRDNAERVADAIGELFSGKPVLKGPIMERLGISTTTASLYLKEAWDRGLIKPANSSRRGWYPGTCPDDAERVAEVVTELSNGEPVKSAAVQKATGLKRSGANRYLREAYRRGLIKPAKPPTSTDARIRDGWLPVHKVKN